MQQPRELYLAAPVSMESLQQGRAALNIFIIIIIIKDSLSSCWYILAYRAQIVNLL